MRIHKKGKEYYWQTSVDVSHVVTHHSTQSPQPLSFNFAVRNGIRCMRGGMNVCWRSLYRGTLIYIYIHSVWGNRTLIITKWKMDWEHFVLLYIIISICVKRRYICGYIVYTNTDIISHIIHILHRMVTSTNMTTSHIVRFDGMGWDWMVVLVVLVVLVGGW